MADITPARKLFDLLISRDFDPETLDSAGRPAADPAQAEIFSFDFRAESGQDYGTVVIMLSDTGDLDVYCADNVGRTMEGPDKDDWFAFLEQLKNFAVRNNRLNFGVKNLNHLRYSMQGQAAIKEGLFESWSGKKDISWNAGATESRLMIKHKRVMGEGEARFRCIESLFIETADGERYKLPFRNLTAGKAMLEHVRAGGRPYDDRGQHIAEMVTELNVLSRFRRANTGKLLEGDTAVLVEKTTAYYETLRHTLKSLTTRGGYGRYFETWNPVELTEESAVIDGLKHLFVTQSIDQRIEDALPLIARIQQQENTMKETEIFEAWAEQLTEGTWQTPDTPEKQQRLIELLSKDLPVGADATNATEQLYDLLGDDELFDQLQALADSDANADARQIILNRMQELDQDPDVMKVITSLNIDATAEMNPAEQTPADLKPTDEAVKDPATQTEDPPGTTQPAYPEYAQDLSSILKHAGVPAKKRMAPDYELEVDEAKGLSNKEIAKKVIDDTGMAKALAGGSEKISGAIPPNMEEGELETAIGAGLGGAIGGIGGAAAGGIAGHYLGKKETDEGTDALQNIDWKEVGGSTAGGVGGWMAGNAVGGPLAGLAGATVGSTIGGALAKDDEPKEGKLGAMAGGIAGGALTKSAKGAMAGAKIGSALQDRVSKNKEMDETANPGVTPADIDGVPTEELDEADRCNMSEAGESCPGMVSESVACMKLRLCKDSMDTVVA